MMFALIIAYVQENKIQTSVWSEYFKPLLPPSERERGDQHLEAVGLFLFVNLFGRRHNFLFPISDLTLRKPKRGKRFLLSSDLMVMDTLCIQELLCFFVTIFVIINAFVHSMFVA